ncbi:MAG: RnfABCDGE type electron transport complex subunit B [Candidatus Omnitrophica bacterium]|nr:RnfABCDGE type electron transport complex subunit B [Candidatus Omnitrophota bacterium]
MVIISSVIILGALGILFGLSLSWAAKKFSVRVDARLEKIYSLLSQANCGACGFSGCLGFAESLLEGKSHPHRCPVTSQAALEKIAKILGVSLESKTKRIAILHCLGGKLNAKDKFEYRGTDDCISANILLGGQKLCMYGCIGLGTCVRVCPFSAIKMNEDNLPVIDEEKCTACGKCVEACPKGLFSIIEEDKLYLVSCKSRDLSKDVLKSCKVGCIACRKCEIACPTGAIKVKDNLATIDYNLCNNCGACFEVCPQKIILKKENKIWMRKT